MASCTSGLALFKYWNVLLLGINVNLWCFDTPSGSMSRSGMSFRVWHGDLSLKQTGCSFPLNSLAKVSATAVLVECLGIEFTMSLSQVLKWLVAGIVELYST